MVNTRSQISRETQNKQPVVDGFVDDEDIVSLADHYSGSYSNQNDEETMRFQERGLERLTIEQRFLEMNEQISELTSMVRHFLRKLRTVEKRRTRTSTPTGRQCFLTVGD